VKGVTREKIKNSSVINVVPFVGEAGYDPSSESYAEVLESRSKKKKEGKREDDSN